MPNFKEISNDELLHELGWRKAFGSDHYEKHISMYISKRELLEHVNHTQEGMDVITQRMIEFHDAKDACNWATKKTWETIEKTQRENDSLRCENKRLERDMASLLKQNHHLKRISVFLRERLNFSI